MPDNVACGELDLLRLKQALALAEQGFGLTDPNPRVGCVIGHLDGHVLGQGHTQQAGGAHAEVMALRAAHTAGQPVQGATAWVTLEPCAHHGRTPPCCDALIAAGIGRVVIAVPDPFPSVDGQGAARLRAAGIDVVELDKLAATLAATGTGVPTANTELTELLSAAHDINIGFFSRIRRGRPWVRMKIAATLDGRTALDDGQSQWITSPQARIDGQRWRRRASAVLTGIGTVLEDDPMLDVRLVPTALQPMCLVVDSRLQTPPTARLLLRLDRRVQIVAAQGDADCQAALVAAGASVLLLPGAGGKVDLAALMQELGRQEINEVHVEAGHKLNGSLLQAGLVDELLVYLAPRLMGPGRGMAALPALSNLSQTLDFEFFECTQVGPDMRLRARLMARLRATLRPNLQPQA